jgi:hypothetical protein
VQLAALNSSRIAGQIEHLTVISLFENLLEVKLPQELTVIGIQSTM